MTSFEKDPILVRTFPQLMEPPKENKITQTDIVNNKMLTSFDNYLTSNGPPVSLPPEPAYEEESAWAEEDVRPLLW